MDGVLRAKTVKARESHKCAWCGEVIYKKEQCHAESGKQDGEFFYNWLHLECESARVRSGLQLDDLKPYAQDRGVAT